MLVSVHAATAERRSGTARRSDDRSTARRPETSTGHTCDGTDPKCVASMC